MDHVAEAQRRVTGEDDARLAELAAEVSVDAGVVLQLVGLDQLTQKTKRESCETSTSSACSCRKLLRHRFVCKRHKEQIFLRYMKWLSADDTFLHYLLLYCYFGLQSTLFNFTTDRVRSLYDRSA